MAVDDSGVIFGNPDAPIPIGFGNPDDPNPIGFGFPTKVAKVRKCATVIRCPGQDFLNYSTECDDVDYAGGTILKCLDQATPIDFFVKAPGIGPWTWDVQNLPDGVMFLVNDFCPSLLNIFGILTSDQTTTTIITVTDGFGNVTVMKITFSTSTVGPCHIVDPTPIICTEEPCPGPGDSFTIELCDGTEQTYTIPADATPEQVLAIQQQAADAYYRALLTCRLTPPPPSPPPPNLLWYNQSQTWTDTCPDGSFFFYTVGANKYAASTLLAANTKALAAAKKQADKLFICITPGTLPDGATGTAYSQQLTATHGTAPYAFTLLSGALPTGLTLSSSGLISGTPTASGLSTFQVKVTDSSNPQKTTTVIYTINVPSPITVSAYWTCDEAAGDYIDKVGGYVLRRALINTVSGKIGNAIGMPGDSWLLTPPIGSGGGTSGPTFNSSTIGCSIFGWVKFSGGNVFVGIPGFYTQNGTGPGIDFQIGPQIPRIRFSMEFASTGPVYIDVDPTPYIGSWVFLCGTWDRAAQMTTLYLNGVSVGTAPVGTTTLDPTATGDVFAEFSYGATFPAPGDFAVDEIGFCLNGVLTQAQVTSLYNCGKGQTWPLNLSSNPSCIAAYWTLNEVGNVTRVDSVAGVQLLATGFSGAGAPALYSNGVEFNLFTSGFQTFSPTELAYTAPNSWSAWGWFNILSAGVGSLFGGPYALFGIGSGTPISIFVGDSVKPFPIYIRAGADDVNIPCTTAAWHFFHLCYNGTTQKYGYSIDNGPVTYFPSVFVLTNAATGGVTLSNTFTTPGDVLYDEIGVITTSMLTPTQQAYLYNSGAGRTWPIVLP